MVMWCLDDHKLDGQQKDLRVSELVRVVSLSHVLASPLDKQSTLLCN